MKNFIQAGDTVTVVSPGVVSGGDGVLIQNTFGIAAYDTHPGDSLELVVEGVFTLPKAAGAISQGTRVYWDNAAKKVTTVAAGNTLVGVATADSLATDLIANVRLNGSF